MGQEKSLGSLLSLLQLPIEEQKRRGFWHTAREIAQQPESWLGTLRIFESNQARIASFLDGVGLREPLEQRPVVMLIGAGTSDYIGRALALLLRQQWKCEVTSCASTDLLPNFDEYVVPGRKYLWISFSRSGDSPEGVALLEQATAKYPQIAHLLVTCNPDARMIAVCGRHSHTCVVVLDDAVNDRSLAMTSSFTNMIVLGQCLAHTWSLGSYRPVVRQLRTAADRLLVEGYEVAAAMANRRFPRVCLVGTGALAAVAKESALKVLEMSAGRVKTMAETTLGLRHGPMASLDRETLFVCFASGDSRRQGYSADLLREVREKQITAWTIGVGPAGAAAAFVPHCDTYLPIEADLADVYRTTLDVLFGQLLGFCTSLEYGLHPDAPSPDGVINRVVQDFSIYH